MSIKLVSTGGGSVTIAEPNTASDFTLSVPSRTGNVALDGPAFSAYNTSNVNLSNDVWSKVTFNTEVFDTASCYDTSNYRFTPNVAGYYLISTNSFITWDGSSPRGIGSAIYKNGSAYAQTKVLTATGTALYGNTPVSAIVYLNGSTDYVETYATCVLGSTVYVQGNNSVVSYWSGSLVRAA